MSPTFAKLFSCRVDEAIYAQPLWVPNLTIGGAQHNVVFVATQNDSLYAFDADTNTFPCNPLWSVSLIDGTHGGLSGETSVPSGATGQLVGVGDGDIAPEVGVTGTPVIDLTTNTLYVVSKSVLQSQSTTFSQRLHAIDLLTGNEKFSGPVTIAGTYPGSGDGTTSVTFNSQQQNQRPGLALVNGAVYIGWGSHEDSDPWHGWLMAYSAATLSQLSTFTTTPNASRAGIWMGGGAPAFDSSNNVYVITGNGTFDATNSSPPNNDYGDSFLKLNGNLALSQYFTPSDQSSDAMHDQDFGSGGSAVLADLPPNGNNPTHLVFGGGKDGYLYLLNRDSMGGSGDNNAWQRLNFGNGIFGTAAFWNSALYLAGRGGKLQEFSLNLSTAMLNTTPTSTTAVVYPFPGTAPSVSSLPDFTDGIVWALDNSQYCTPQSLGCGPAVLHAYDATNLATEFWNSSQIAGDTAGNAVKFTVPTVANGKVYVGTRGNNTGGSDSSTSVPGELDVYGLAPELLSIAVTPANPSIVLGTTEQFTATGTYTDSTTKDLTSTAVWSSDTTTTATINSTGLANSIGAGTAGITATVGAVSGKTTLTVTSSSLVSITVAPASPSIPLGTTQAFTATGHYNDGSTQDLTSAVHWSTSDGTIATISNTSGTYGVASSVAVGSVTITATSGSISGTAQLSITPAALVSISVTPANQMIALGQTQQFAATGTYTDKSTKDITTNVTWTSSSATVATISNNTGSIGLATSTGTGSVTITATIGAVFGTTGMTVTSGQLVSIAVTPANSSIAAGKTQQFTATGTYTDNSTANLTSSVVWASTITTVATISPGGNATGISQGGTTIKATSGSVVGSTSLTVSAPVLTGVIVTPANPSITLGLTAQFTAMAVYSDSSTQNVTNSANWTSSNNSIATVSSTGLASTLAQGATTIGASFGGQSGSTTLTVGPPALVSIAVTPNPATVSAGSSVHFTATGTYTNQSTANISSLATWTSTNNSVSTVNGTGLAQTTNAGTATITATMGAVQGTASLTVTSVAPPAVAYIGVHGTCAVKTNLGCTISGLNMSAANFIVMSISDYDESGTGGTPSDSQNNLWFGPYLECSSAGPCTVNTKIYFCVNCAVSSSQTFTWTSSGDYPSLTVEGFSGMPQYSPFSQWVKATNSGSSLSTGALTPNTNGQLCITTLAQGTNGGTPAVSPLNPFYLTDVQANVSNLVGYGMAYEIQTTATALSATWSGYGSGPSSALLTCFLPSLGQPVYDWYQDNENSTDGTAITATIVQNGRHVADPNLASSGIVIGSGGTAKISNICQHPETTSKNVGGNGYNSASGTRGLLLQTVSGGDGAGWNYQMPGGVTVLSGGNFMEESYWEWPGLSSTDTTGYYSMGSPSNSGGDYMGNMHHAGKHYIEAGANPNGKADSCTGTCDANGFYTLVRDTSTTSNTIGTGSNLTFTTAVSDGWAAGTSLIITNSLATMANAVSGTVVSDTGTTLVFQPTIAVGSGTYSSWTIIPWNFVKMQYNGYKVLGPGTSSCTVAAGSCTITTASALGLSAGTVVSYFNTTTKGVSGTVISDSGTTLVMNVVNIYGSGSLTSGNISTSAHELIIEDSLGNVLSTQYKIANPAQPGAPNKFGSGFGGDGGVAGSSYCHDGETVHWIGASEFNSLAP
jgi:hypothetical protein